jgi:hypothetical protein
MFCMRNSFRGFSIFGVSAVGLYICLTYTSFWQGTKLCAQIQSALGISPIHFLVMDDLNSGMSLTPLSAMPFTTMKLFVHCFAYQKSWFFNCSVDLSISVRNLHCSSTICKKFKVLTVPISPTCNLICWSPAIECVFHMLVSFLNLRCLDHLSLHMLHGWWQCLKRLRLTSPHSHITNP